jgi:hypothetical protein
MKYIAKQVPPEAQESPIYTCDSSYIDGLIFSGNRDYQDRFGTNTDSFTYAKRELEDGYLWADLVAIDERRFGDTIFKNATEAITDRFPREKPYTTREIGKIKKIVYKYGEIGTDDNLTVCELLEIVSGEYWGVCEIHGCCQGEWQTVIYRRDLWDYESLHTIESEYFNTGTEWLVYAEGEDYADGDFYTAAYDVDFIRLLIARDFGIDPADIDMHVFDGLDVEERYTIA